MRIGLGFVSFTLALGLASPFAAVSAQEPPAGEQAPAAAAAPTAAAVPTREQIIGELAKALKVDKTALADDTDLVAGLQLDASDVYYAVQELFENFGVKAPSNELTRVGDIIAGVEAAVKSAAVKKRSFKAAAPTLNTYVQTVFYATDRKATGAAEPEGAFGAERAPEGRMSYGRAEVNIPFSHKQGQIETPWLGLKSLLDPKKHIYVLKADTRDEAVFFSEVGAPGPNDILLYIHGFNVTFENALQRAAQISFDFGFKGTPVAFTWPSYGGVTGYNTDWENANWATKHLETFITKLSESANGRKIHVIAHSMGNKALLGALRLMSYRGEPGPIFKSAILCAPDFDAGMFREQVAAEIKPLASQWVVYSSDKDIALLTSERLNTPRLGKPVTYAEGFEIIDASGIEVTPWSVPETHSYYAAKKVVLDDMVKVLGGMAPADRGLISKAFGADTVWTFGP